MLALVVVSFVKGARVWRAYRRSHGHYTKSEQAVRQQRLDAKRSWGTAKFLLGELGSGHVPDLGVVWAVVLHDGEHVMADVQAHYARYYSSDTTYSHANGAFFGRASFMAAGYGLTALSNRSRRRAAQLAGQAQWREHQHVRVLMTDQRSICCMSDGRVLSFYHQAVVAIYPEPENWSLVLDFSDTSALRISGAGGPPAAVVAVWAAYGPEGLRNHPGLVSLRD